MPLVQLARVCLAYGHVALLEHVDLVVEPAERIGLIGRNGSGKSSLLRLIEGVAPPDDGTVWKAPGLMLASVAQEPAFAGEASVFEAVAEGVGPARQLIVDYHAAAHTGDLERMQRLHETLDAAGGWAIEHRIEATVSRLALPADAAMSALSGGQKKRVALARALVSDPALLILDEPTNHLDIDAIEWLEETLLAFAGSVLFVTHDRRFLDRVAQRIVELDRGRLASFPGNFSAYESRKAEMLAIEDVVSRKFDKELAQEEAWIRKGVEARRTRNEGRVRRLERLRMERAARRDRLGRVDLALSAGERSGKLVAELEDVSKTYDEGKRVVEGFSCRVMRGDKIGFIGPNGSGKTTLLQLILGQIAPDSGRVRLGTRVSVAYFDQFRSVLDEEATLADTISPGSDFLEIDGAKKHVVSYLGDFLFPPERARSPVKSLSGGERNRLLLARLFSRPANVIVLDEPTNDLDIETLELLESLLQDYAGTLLLVSHDREFLDNVVTQTIAYEGDARWKEYAGGYADWVRAKKASGEDEQPSSRPSPKEEGEKRPRLAQPPRPKKLTYNETRELEALPAKLAALEEEQAELGRRIADPEIYRDRSVDVRAMHARHVALEDEITALLTRWEDLESRA